MRWFFDRLDPLAFNPGGTALSTTALGVGNPWLGIRHQASFGHRARRRSLVRLRIRCVVPLHQRFSIWIVPRLYAGVALLIDRTFGVGHSAFARRRWALLATATLVLFVEFRLFWDILARGQADLEARRRSTVKHQLDDRAAVRWLMSQRKPGDVLMTTPLALSRCLVVLEDSDF